MHMAHLILALILTLHEDFQTLVLITKVLTLANQAIFLWWYDAYQDSTHPC